MTIPYAGRCTNCGSLMQVFVTDADIQQLESAELYCVCGGKLIVRKVVAASRD